MEIVINEKYSFILELLKVYDGELIDCCYEICMWCDEKGYDFEEQADCLQVFFEYYEKIKSIKTKEIKSHISEEQEEILIKNYGKFVDEVLNVNLKKAYQNGYSAQEFYRSLWIGICNSGIITTLTEKAFAMYYIAIDMKIPYFYLRKGVLMSNEEFRICMKKNEEGLQKIRFILSSEYSQKTEEASLILNELIDAESFEDQIIIMTGVLSTLRSEKNRMRKLIQKLNEEFL